MSMDYDNFQLHMNEKSQLERATLDYFIKAYNHLEKKRLELIKHGDRPDFITKDSLLNEIIGIEVKELFYDSDEAKILLGRSDTLTHGMMLIDRLIIKLNDLIEKASESAKKYEFKSSLFLVIRIASPIFDKEDFQRFRDNIRVTLDTFSQIWLLFYNNSTLNWDNLERIK